MEIKKELNEIGKMLEFNKEKGFDFQRLQDWGSSQEMTQSDADAAINQRLEGDIKEKEGIVVQGPESAKPYLDRAYSHMVKSRAYERQANDLERKIQRGIEAANKMSEVKSLRQKADREKREADKYNRYARMELSRM